MIKISVWISVSDLVEIKKTSFEKVLQLVDRKHKLFGGRLRKSSFKTLRNAGVNGVELLISSYTSTTDVDRCLTILSQNKMQVFSVHQSLSNQRNISLIEIERLCRIANKFSSKIVVLHSGTLRNNLFNYKFIEQLKRLQKKYSLRFGIENMSIMPFSTLTYTYNPTEFETLVKKLEMFITLDTTHLAQAGGDITKFYKSNKKSIVNIHLSDYQRDWINSTFKLPNGSHLPLEKGSLDIKKFITSLKKDYKGPITMEINGNIQELAASAKLIKKYYNTASL